MQIRPLQKADAKGGFTCGVPALDLYFAKHAWTHESASVARVYVLEDDQASGAIVVGYYTLSAREVDRARLLGPLPGSAFPKRPLPVFYIGCFAVAKGRQGQGLGRRLMGDALRRCLDGLEAIGSVGISLDSYDEASTRFYQGLGFELIPHLPSMTAPYPQPMFLPMKTLQLARPAGT